MTDETPEDLREETAEAAPQPLPLAPPAPTPRRSSSASWTA